MRGVEEELDFYLVEKGEELP